MEPSDLTMRCGDCGELNRLPAGHCKRCGAKLDFEAAERRILRGNKRTIGARIKILLALALALAVLLLVWPGSLERQTGTEFDAQSYRLKTALLLQALDRGLPAAQAFTEKEINAHLRELVSAQPSRRGVAPALEDVAIRLTAGQAMAFIAVRRGPVKLTALISIRTQAAELMVEGVTIGHLPLPGMLGRLYARTQSRLLAQMGDESRILQNLDGAALSAGAIEVLVK